MRLHFIDPWSGKFPFREENKKSEMKVRAGKEAVKIHPKCESVDAVRMDSFH